MRVITTTQGDDAWKAARAGVLTASCLGDLMAKTKTGPSTSRANLIAKLAVERITGAQDDGYTNPAMLRGIELEDVARCAYEAQYGVLVETTGFCLHDDYDFVGCSVDGLLDDDGVWEAKCPVAMAKHLAALRTKGKATADEYAWQVQGQLFVTERKWCDVATYDPRFPAGLQLVVCRVMRDEAKIEELRLACIAADEEITAIVEELRGM